MQIAFTGTSLLQLPAKNKIQICIFLSSKSLNSFPERRFEYFIYLMSINIENSTNIKNLLGGEGCLWYLEELSDHSQHGGHVSVISEIKKNILEKITFAIWNNFWSSERNFQGNWKVWTVKVEQLFCIFNLTLNSELYSSKLFIGCLLRQRKVKIQILTFHSSSELLHVAPTLSVSSTWHQNFVSDINIWEWWWLHTLDMVCWTHLKASGLDSLWKVKS